MLGHLTMMLHIVFLHRLGNVFQEDFLRNLKAPALCILISVILIKELVTQLLPSLIVNWCVCFSYIYSILVLIHAQHNESQIKNVFRTITFLLSSECISRFYRIIGKWNCKSHVEFFFYKFLKSTWQAIIWPFLGNNTPFFHWKCMLILFFFY